MRTKLFLTPLLVLLVFAGTTDAQADTLPRAGTIPGSPLYILEIVSEGIGSLFIFGDVAKAERHLALAAERLAEARELANRGKADSVEKAIEHYQKRVDRALGKAEKAKMNGKDATGVLNNIAEATLRHQEVLAGVLEKVPDQAKAAIQRAIENSMKGHTKALDVASREEHGDDVDDKRMKDDDKEGKTNNDGKRDLDDGDEDKNGDNDSDEGKAVFCTLDVKECPDGSFVGRVAPLCEFEACPIATVSPLPTLLPALPPSPESTSDSVADRNASPQTVTIAYTNSGFSPAVATIDQGGTVVFVNNSTHNMWIGSNWHPSHTQYPETTPGDCLGSAFDSCANIPIGDSWQFQFNSLGTWGYHNHSRPGHTGTVMVR